MLLTFGLVRGPVGGVVLDNFVPFEASNRTDIDPNRPLPDVGQPQTLGSEVATTSRDRR